jgi:hypothetical protein
MRRLIERGLLALLVAALLQVLVAPGTGPPPRPPTTRWCKNDPYIDVNGRRLHVWVASTEAIFPASSAPTRVQIAVPSGASRHLIGTDDGFGFGYDVEFIESDELAATDQGVQIAVSVFVPASRPLPVKVDLTTPTNQLLEWQTGATNDWIVATTQL